MIKNQQHNSKPSDPKEVHHSDPKELKHNYGHKRSILRKLMIAQRKKFMIKKEQCEFNRLKSKLADTSISNFSQAEEGNDEKADEKAAENANQSQNIKYKKT